MKQRIKGDWNEVKGMLRQIFSEAEEKNNETGSSQESSQERKSEQYNKPINPNF